MFVLGVTGGIGSGKSTVARLLEERGARVLDADRIVRELYAGGAVAQDIERAFGPEMRAQDGSVDRKALAGLVFTDAAARKRLERIVHPAVRGEVECRLAGFREEGYAGIAVIDAALLVESDYEYPLDALLVVTAPEEIRLERLKGRGVPADEARRRIRAQAGDDEKVREADRVIDNAGSLEDLGRAVDGLLAELERDGGTGSG